MFLMPRFMHISFGWSVLLALNSIIGSYYYLRVIVAMYMREPKRVFSAGRVPFGVAAVLTIAAAGMLYLGLFPSHVMAFAIQAALQFH